MKKSIVVYDVNNAGFKGNSISFDQEFFDTEIGFMLEELNFLNGNGIGIETFVSGSILVVASYGVDIKEINAILFPYRAKKLCVTDA